MKKILKVIIVIAVIIGMIKILDTETKSAINDCMTAGHTQNYCQKLAR